jgi:DNA-binding MarR family transcriptional regulator
MSQRPQKPSHEDILWLEDYLPYRLAVVAARMLRDAARIYKGRRNPLTTPQWRVLGILANFEPLNATEIGRISMLDKVAVSRALAQLHKRGFVARQRMRDDRRIRYVSLTAAGWRYYSELVPEMIRQEQALRQVLDPADLKRLFEILETFERYQRSDACIR